jgi:hypothetical protein
MKNISIKCLSCLVSAVGLLLCTGCQTHHFKDFDVAANTFDPNPYPLNPRWGKQVEQNVLPNPSQSCPLESDSDNPDDWTSSPQYPNCMSDPPSFNGGIWCGPHVNLMPVTYEGTAIWDDHSSSLLDDDYTFNVLRDDQALYSTAESEVHVEFNSDETVDNWDDTHTWWDNFHHNAVDVDKAHASAMLDGHFVKVIGLLNLDTLHRGKTELHPAYAVFVDLGGTDVLRTSWAFFVRNWGDQGFCGSDDQPLFYRPQQIRVQIPNVVSLTSNNIWEGAQNDDNLQPMGVSIQPNGDGMLVTFTLLQPSKQSWFVGDLTFAAREPSKTGAGAAVPAKATGVKDDGDPDRNPDSELQAKIDRLPAAAKKDLYAKLGNLIPRKKAHPVKPVLIAEPTKLEVTRHESPVRVAVKSDSVAMRMPATTMVNRQRRVEFVKKYLADLGAK